MASVLSAIQTQLVTDVETTSIVKCHVGSAVNENQYPNAEIWIGGGDIDQNLTEVQDRLMGFIVRVRGSSQETGELAIEELLELWRTSTGYGARLAALQALSVITIYPTFAYTPVITAGSTTQQPFVADIEFAMIVRYT